MARALLVAQRGSTGVDSLESCLGLLNQALTPDNIEPRPPVYARAHGVLSAIFSPSRAARLHGASIAVGALVSSHAEWHKPGAAVPEGTFALFRADASRVELAADAAGSRTIWYVLLDDKLIASTSQRAIVALLGSFELNRNVLPWVLSSGTLGGGAWDERLAQVGPGERVTLDRASWTITRSAAPIVFEPDSGSGEAVHAERLRAAVESVCRDWSFDAGEWALPLSGGTDSRGLLALLPNRRGLKTITWGTNDARTEDGNDARIASELAEAFGVDNRFFPTDFSAEPRDRLVSRFIAAGEGRVAKISGYLDGFKMWKTLFEEGLGGIIRGDEAFGSMFVRNTYGARHTASLTLLTDYFRPDEIDALELPPQRVPDHLERRSEETLSTWRDRLYREFRVPHLLAALTDLKTAYVEVANPLLSRPVLEVVRRLPDDMRTGKRAWRDLVRSLSPTIPYASAAAVLSLKDFVNDKSMLQLMLAEMESSNAAQVFGTTLRRQVGGSIRAALASELSPVKRAPPRMSLMNVLPLRVRRRWITTLKPVLPSMVFAFRAFLVSRMHAQMKADSTLLFRGLSRVANL